jgi:hypothetical protein
MTQDVRIFQLVIQHSNVVSYSTLHIFSNIQVYILNIVNVDKYLQYKEIFRRQNSKWEDANPRNICKNV